MSPTLALLFLCVAIPFAITLGIGAAMLLCEWVHRRMTPTNQQEQGVENDRSR